MNRARLAALLVSALIVVLTLAACSADRWAGVESGEYTLVRGLVSSGAGGIRTVRIDRKRQSAVFTLGDGFEVAVTFTPWDRQRWPSGCPANIGSTRMEVMDIVESPLALGPMTFSDPFLIRDCPPSSQKIVLREGSAFDPSGTACSQLEKCLIFKAEDITSRQ